MLMKSIFRYMLAACLALSVLSACSSSDEPTLPSIKLTSGETQYTVTDEAQTLSLSFNASLPWTATTSAALWCKLSHSEGGGGDVQLTLSVAANGTYDSRNAVVNLLIDGEVMQTIRVMQAQKDAIVVAQSEYAVAAKGETLAFDIETNMTDISVKIEDAEGNAADWIKQVPASRALQKVPLAFEVTKNLSGAERTATIVLGKGDVEQRIGVKQGVYSLLVIQFSGLTLPAPGLGEGYLGTIDWGDGNVEPYGTQLEHTYDGEGTVRTVRVEGSAAESFSLGSLEGIDGIDVTQF